MYLLLLLLKSQQHVVMVVFVFQRFVFHLSNTASPLYIKRRVWLACVACVVVYLFSCLLYVTQLWSRGFPPFPPRATCVSLRSMFSPDYSIVNACCCVGLFAEFLLPLLTCAL